VGLQHLFNNWKILRNKLRVLGLQERLHVLQPVRQAVQLARHCPRHLQGVLHLLDLLISKVLDLGPARVDGRLPVAEGAASVRMSSTDDVGTETLTVLQQMTLAGQLTVKQL